jgi:hypothetical protein
VDKDGKTKDRSAVFDRYGKATKIGLGRPMQEPLIYRLYAVDVGQNKRIVSAVADTRKVTTVSTSQPMVEISTDSCYTGTS